MNSFTSQGTSAGKDPLKSDSSDGSAYTEAASIFHRRVDLISRSDVNPPFLGYARLLNNRHTVNFAKEGH